VPLWGIFALGLIAVCVLVLVLLNKGHARGSSDAQIIDRLVNAGSDLTRAHEIEFLFFFPSRASADEAVTRLKADGYTVSIEETITGTRWVLLATGSMVPLLSAMQPLRSRFDELAAREGGVFDGWRAVGVR
jgi:regulator of ribonuclease activity B